MSEVQETEQPVQDSVEDRVANLLGADEPAEGNEAASPETSEPAEETFELEIDGAKYTLPKKLEDGFMQRKDYTQKTQTLAEQRKDVERQIAQIKLAQSAAAFENSVAQERQQLSIMDAVLAEYDAMSLKDLQPQDMMVKMLERDQLRHRRNALDEQLKAKRAQFDQATKAELDKLKSESLETLKKRINWSDETEKEVRDYVRDIGITDAEYDSVFDPRHKQILWEASQYRKLKAGAQPAAQQVKAVRTSSANPMPQAVKDKLNFNKAIAKTKPGSSERRHLVEDRVAKIFG